MIEQYSFGNLVYKGKTFTRDLIILFSSGKERIISSWWRKEGHYLQVEDLEEVWDFSPDWLVVGTGAYGVMKVSPEVEAKAKELNIKLIALPTAEAVKKFNELLKTSSKLAGAFHLTC